MRLISSIEVAERISVDFGRLMPLALRSGWHVFPGKNLREKFETIEQNNNSAVIFKNINPHPHQKEFKYLISQNKKNTNIPVSLKN